MGSGQSKFGRGNKNMQYPYGAPPYSQYAATQQPFMPPYGGGFIPPGQPMFAQPQMQQYGVIPPEFYGQAAYNRPPRMMGWLPQDKPPKKKKKSRKTHSENFVGGFAGEAPSEARHQRAQSESRHRPDPDGPSMPVPEIQRSTTANSSRGRNRRAPTPFIPPSTRRDDRDHEEDRPRGLRNNDTNRNYSRRRSPVRYDTPEPIDDDIQRILRPMPSAESVVYGPKGERPRRRLTNPLPPPPRDIYEMTPYKGLADLPRTSAALLATTYGSRQHVYDAENPTVKRNKSVKGILRAFSKKEKSKEPVQVVPIFKGSQVQFQSQLTQPQTQMPQPQAQQPQPQFPQGQMQQSQIAQPQMQMPQGPATQPDIPQMQQSQLTQPQMQMPQGPGQPADIPQMPQSQLTQPQMQMPQGPNQLDITPQMPMQQSQLTQPQMQMPQPQSDKLHRSGSRSSRNYAGIGTPGPNYLQPQNIQFPQPGGGSSHYGSSPMHSQSSPSSDPIPPVPPVPSNPPPIQFDQFSPLNGFLSHSQYRVLYRNQMYRTALHLHEAMKFIDTRPDIAEMIRRTPDIHSVYPLAQQYQEFMRNDWQHKCVEFMEEVVWLKTRQHPDLRSLLLNTGFANIEYIDPIDGFWGTGPSGDGQNHLGKIMTRVREKLRS